MPQKPVIHIPEKTKHARKNKKEDTPKQRDSSTLKARALKLYMKPSPNNQSLLPSMQEEFGSNYTPRVSSPEVVQEVKTISITVSWLLVMELTTILLRTHGEILGEKLVTSD